MQWNEFRLGSQGIWRRKGLLRRDQETLIGSVINFQDKIDHGDSEQDGEEQFGTVWEGVRLTMHLNKQGSSWYQQANEGVEKIKERDLTKTYYIKDQIN